MKKIFIIVVVIVVAVIGYFLYSIRPVSEPTQSVQSVSDTIPIAQANTVYRISQADSKVEFTINEMLYGKPKLVVGTTTQIAGDMTISSTSKLELGTMKINATTLNTDSSKRDGAIVRLILKSDKPENEYIVFKPKSSNLDIPVVMGTTTQFDVSGDLTISGVTKTAMFKVEMIATTEKITGKAVTTIKRGDFNIVIPNFSFLANIDESFEVTVNVVANRVSE